MTLLVVVGGIGASAPVLVQVVRTTVVRRRTRVWVETIERTRTGEALRGDVARPIR